MESKQFFVSRKQDMPGRIINDKNKTESISNCYSIHNKKSCFVSEDDIRERINVNVLNKTHYNNDYQKTFDNDISY